MKAFKMACLTYEPSTVTFENRNYTREQLIDAKYSLMQYTLSQLKHLDLGEKKFNNILDQQIGAMSSQGTRTAAHTD